MPVSESAGCLWKAACRWKVRERTAAGGQRQSGRTELSLSLEKPAGRTEFRKEGEEATADRREQRLGAVRRGQKSLAHRQGGGGELDSWAERRAVDIPQGEASTCGADAARPTGSRFCRERAEDTRCPWCLSPPSGRVGSRGRARGLGPARPGSPSGLPTHRLLISCELVSPTLSLGSPQL